MPPSPSPTSSIQYAHPRDSRLETRTPNAGPSENLDCKIRASQLHSIRVRTHSTARASLLDVGCAAVSSSSTPGGGRTPTCRFQLQLEDGGSPVSTHLVVLCNVQPDGKRPRPRPRPQPIENPPRAEKHTFQVADHFSRFLNHGRLLQPATLHLSAPMARVHAYNAGPVDHLSRTRSPYLQWCMCHGHLPSGERRAATSGAGGRWAHPAMTAMHGHVSERSLRSLRRNALAGVLWTAGIKLYRGQSQASVAACGSTVTLPYSITCLFSTSDRDVQHRMRRNRGIQGSVAGAIAIHGEARARQAVERGKHVYTTSASCHLSSYLSRTLSSSSSPTPRRPTSHHRSVLPRIPALLLRPHVINRAILYTPESRRTRADAPAAGRPPPTGAIHT